MKRLILTIFFVFMPAGVFAADNSSINIYPDNIIQGDPIMIAVSGAATTSTTTVRGISFGNKSLGIFSYQGLPTALYGFDINKSAGIYKASVKFSDGTVLSKQVVVGLRQKAEITFNIPVKLGGNATSSQRTLVSTLATENSSLLGLKTGTKAFWTDVFAFPVTNPIITDTFGYSRKTGGTLVTHKGIDFHAPMYTSVTAINRGIVRLTRETRNYGKTIVVDHGLGVMSFYMHLSQILVNEGELVSRGQIIGLSGQTGYAENPHLHLTIRINDISIDPVKFFGLFGVKVNI